MGKMLRPASLVLAVAIAGCAEHASINSNPSGAKVYWRNQLVGTTPTQLSIGRNEDWPTTPGRVDADGYEQLEFQIKSRVPASRIVCYILTSGLCLIWKRPSVFSEQSYTFNLKPLPASEVAAEPADGAPSGDTSQRLRKLQGLYDEGLLSDQEFKQQRAKILRGL